MNDKTKLERATEVLRHARDGERGMSLIEIMVVITIIGLMMGVIGVGVMGALGQAKADTTKNQIQNLALALKSYKIGNGRYPTTSEGLQSLVSPPASAKKKMNYLDSDKIPLDAWDQEFIYYSPGTHGDHDFEIISYGSDGQAGGEGDAADINSWE